MKKLIFLSTIFFVSMFFSNAYAAGCSKTYIGNNYYYQCDGVKITQEARLVHGDEIKNFINSNTEASWIYYDGYNKTEGSFSAKLNQEEYYSCSQCAYVKHSDGSFYFLAKYSINPPGQAVVKVSRYWTNSVLKVGTGGSGWHIGSFSWTPPQPAIGYYYKGSTAEAWNYKSSGKTGDRLRYCQNVRAADLRCSQQKADFPVLSFDYSPSKNPIDYNSNIELKWSSQNTDSCIASGDWVGNKAAVSGSENKSKITTNKTYTLTCSGPGGSLSKTLNIGVLPGPTCIDGKKNGTETGIDCGGSCQKCVPLSCTDGIKNGKETGVDCGGDCKSCFTCEQVKWVCDNNWQPSVCPPNGIQTQTCTNIPTSTTTCPVIQPIEPPSTQICTYVSPAGMAYHNTLSTCTATQTDGPSNGRTYVNRQMTWTVDLPAGLATVDVTGTEWSGTNILVGATTSTNILNKIYTTVGLKNIRATTTVITGTDTYTITCATSTNVIMGGGSVIEI